MDNEIGKELVPVYEKVFNGRMTKLVDGRELHKALQNKRKFTDWIKQRVDTFGFVENEDFTRFHNFVKGDENGFGNKTTTEYALTLDMAKQLCMVENNEIGRQVRRYFIEIENQLSVPMTYEEALEAHLAQIKKNRVLQEQNNQLTNTIGLLSEEKKELQITLDKTNEDLQIHQRRSRYLDTIMDRKDLRNLTDIGNDYAISAKKMNRILYILGILKDKGNWRVATKYLYLGLGTVQTFSNGNYTGSCLYYNQRGCYFMYVLLGALGIKPTTERNEDDIKIANKVIKYFDHIWDKSNDGRNKEYFKNLNGETKNACKDAIKQFVIDLKDGKLDEFIGNGEYDVEDIVESDYDMVDFYID